MITKFGNKNNSSKEKKKKKEEKKATLKTTSFLLQAYLFARVLVGWVVAVAENARPLPLDFFLAGMGKVAKINSWL